MSILRYLAILLVLATGGSAAASEQRDASDADRFATEMREAGDMIRRGLEKMLETIDSTLQALPRYEMPTIDDNGDIVIRRKHPVEPDADQDRRGRTI
jgi:hypothetical protein